jgi:hypothetical protein
MTDMTVYDLDQDSSGNVYVCGTLSSSSKKVYIVKYSGGTYTTLFQYGSISSGSRPNGCLDIAVSDDGQEIITTDRGNSGHFVSSDGGATWTGQTSWDSDSSKSYTTYEIVESGGGFYTSGGSSADNARFFSPSASGSFYNQDVNTIDSEFWGQAYAIATPDGGTTWLAGLYHNFDDIGYTDGIHYSTDGGLTWNDATVTIDEGTSVSYLTTSVYDIACHSNGTTCIAVGMTGNATNGADVGGMVLYSTDAGRTWTNLQSSVLESVGTRSGFQGVTFYGDYFFILGGDAFISGSI